MLFGVDLDVIYQMPASKVDARLDTDRGLKFW
jgi:hypothetical protein